MFLRGKEKLNSWKKNLSNKAIKENEKKWKKKRKKKYIKRLKKGKKRKRVFPNDVRIEMWCITNMSQWNWWIWIYFELLWRRLWIILWRQRVGWSYVFNYWKWE